MTEIFFHAALSASLLTAIFLEVSNVSYYLQRDGEYIGFYFPLTYFSLTFLLFDRQATRWRRAICVWLLAVTAASLRLHYAYGGGLPILPHPPMFVLAVVLGGALALARAASRTRFAMPAAAVFIALTLMLPCRFVRDDRVADAEQAIRAVAGNRTPHIYFDKHDPVGDAFLNSVTASFTERAWLQHGDSYPDMSKTENVLLTHFHTGDLIVVLTSTVGDGAAVRGAAERQLGELRPVTTIRLDRSGLVIWAYFFEIAADGDGNPASPESHP